MSENEPIMAGPQVGSARKNMQVTRKRILIALTLIFLVIALVVFLYWLLIGQYYETTDDAYVAGNRIEVMPQVSGNVIEILADETDLVKKGDPLVKLDKTDAEIELQKAESELALTILNVNELYDSVNQLSADVDLQQKNYDKALADYERRKGLQVNQSISIEDLEHAKITAATTENALKVAKAKLAETLDLIGRSDLYDHPTVQQAANNVRSAYLRLERTTIYAPETGHVAKRPVEVGQQVTTSKVMMIIVPTEQVWVDANFKESQLKKMRIGQPASITADVYSSDVKFKGHLVGLGPGTGSSFDLLPPQNATGNWIKVVQRLPVRLAIDAEDLKKYPLKIGLSITATVDTHDKKGEALLNAEQNNMTYKTKEFSSDTSAAEALVTKILRETAKNISAPKINN